MSHKNTREEIAKQFDLPERQSKIESLLREPEIYCICRSSDSTRFMIACDACEEWYHGDCVNVTQSDANNIHHYYCQWCIEKDPSLEIEYKKKGGSGKSGRDKSQKSEGKSAGRGKKAETKSYGDEKVERSRGCGACSGCLNKRDCGRCDSCKKNSKKEGAGRKKTCLKRICMDGVRKEKESFHKKEEPTASSVLTAKHMNDEMEWKPPAPSTSGAGAAGGGKQRKRRKQVQSKNRKRYSDSPTRESEMSPSSDDTSENEEPRQCYWHQCLNAARAGSKYCSEECGIQLATDRILRLLPTRIQEWTLTTSVADENNKKKLEEIRRKQMDCKRALEELETKRNALDEHIEYIEKMKIDPGKADEGLEEEEGSIYCVTCGHEIPVKTCIKHMERCYNKYESQTSFGSAFKTELEGKPIFCDFFHAASGTYCKRLRVLCPEHSKEPKISDTAICGYPLVSSVAGRTDKMCRVPKKKCNRHHCWEKARRGEIDLEKVRYWLKLDELITQERASKQQLTDRAGVLGLLLHSTFDHEIREKLHREMTEADKKKEEESQPEQEELDVKAETVVKVETQDEPEGEERRVKKKFKAVVMEYDDDYEMVPQHSKNREHNRKQSANRSAEEKEEMTASKMLKMDKK